MPELGPYGSVRGARGNSRPYREHAVLAWLLPVLTHLRHRPDPTDMVARPLGPAEIEALSLSQLRQVMPGVRASARCLPQSTIKHCG
jgi:hypothetical protein